MMLTTPPPEVARAGLRALRMVVAADGEIHDLERRFVAAVQSHILHSSFDFDTLEPIEPEELARAVPEPFRERVVHGCLCGALIDGEAISPSRDRAAPGVRHRAPDLTAVTRPARGSSHRRL